MIDHISYTQINTYLSCPLKYNFQYVEKIPWPFKPEGLVFGSAIHQALEHYYTGRKEGRAVPESEMLALYDAAWEKEESEFPWSYSDKETCYLLEGQVEVTPEGAAPVTFGKGDLVTFPKGMSCKWKITKAVRKHYTFGD